MARSHEWDLCFLLLYMTYRTIINIANIEVDKLRKHYLDVDSARMQLFLFLHHSYRRTAILARELEKHATLENDNSIFGCGNNLTVHKITQSNQFHC